jgi:hypothetical protein
MISHPNMPRKESRVPYRKKIKIQGSQRLRMQYLIAAGSAVAAILILILYFNLTKNEEMKANEAEKDTLIHIPDDLIIDQPVIEPSQAQLRGIPYKTVRKEKTFPMMQP